MALDILLIWAVVFNFIYTTVVNGKVKECKSHEQYIENCIITDEQKLAEDEKRITRLEEKVRE